LDYFGDIEKIAEELKKEDPEIKKILFYFEGISIFHKN